MKVKAVLRYFFTVLDRLQVALLGVQNEVELFDDVDRDGHAALDGLLAHVLNRLAVAADFFTDRLQARVGDGGGARVERGAQLDFGVDHAFERAVVEDPRHVEALLVRLPEGRLLLLQPLFGEGQALFERLDLRLGRRGGGRRRPRGRRPLRRRRRRLGGLFFGRHVRNALLGAVRHEGG
ncbi:MAG TPA: hypothetical protein VFS00_22155 [Polyangiaceae bacterium]|nr:hypothetical protein [Polyangiaceae bacterium]